jgi:phosphate starvation-inducible PhoH-like protein
MSKNSKRNQKNKSSFISPSELSGVSLSPSQKNFMNTILDNKISICYGPAGTSKTFTACFTALKLLAEGKIEKIILTKPIQESGEKLGHLPGTVEEKIDPFMESFLINMTKMIGKESTGFLISNHVIEFRPLAYMRGATFDDCIMILDEAQNADFRQLILFITRMSKTSKVIISGDVSQYDIARNKVALPDFSKMIEDINGVGVFLFKKEDIVRDPILIEITDKYEKWRSEHEKE